MSDVLKYNRVEVSLPSLRVPRKPVKYNEAEDLNSPRCAQPLLLPNSKRTFSLCPTYSPLNETSYMEQCFNDIKYLAEGSFGTVYQVQSKNDSKFYAVKMFKHRIHPNNQGLRSRRIGEIERYANIPYSRFCVEFISGWEEKHYIHIQMELCQATLTQFAARNDCVSEGILWRIFLDVLSGIKHLHSHHYVHLDIKPDNILVSSDNIFKIADFGLLVDLSKGAVNDAQEGDARYLAPELLRSVYTQAADIFSLGLTMYELGCAMHLPSCGQFWHQLRHGDLPFHPFLCQSRELFGLIKLMTGRDHVKRPSAEKLLKQRKLQKMQRSRCVSTLFHGVTSTLKSFCLYGRMAAINCGLGVLKPFASRVCPVLWKRDAQSGEKAQELTINRRSWQLDTQCPSTSSAQTDAELFQTRLAACKKRLTFDDNEQERNTNSVVQAPSPPRVVRSNGGTNRNGSTPKRRRLFD